MEDKEVHRLVKQRMEKAAELREAGLNPYANDFRPELTCEEFIGLYGDAEKEALAEVKTTHTLAGRLVAQRTMGKVTFLRIRDRSGEVQLFIKKDRVGEDTYKLLKLADLGDILGVAGSPMKTKTGELSVAADGLRVLTKSLHPLPDKFHGLTNTEQRYRHRYIDLAVNPEVRETFRTRSRIIRGIQQFLDRRDFIEVETPILGEEAGGALARPFVTHHNALDMDLYMRIATELHLKRLVVGGFERVYEIGRLFRNEGISTKHNPEFTTIEFYQAYATYTDLMELTEELICGLVENILGTQVVRYGEREIDFSRPWRRVAIATLVQEHLGLDEDLRHIHSVERALAVAAGHTVTPEALLLTCLKELTDEEAEQFVPGLPARVGDEGIVGRALRAFKDGGEDFYPRLGKAIDGALSSGGALTSSMPSEENTDELEEATDPGAGPGARRRRAANPDWVRRRRLALHLLYDVFDHEIEETLTNPTFITDFSVNESPLARSRDGDPAVVDRFELIVAGMEVANAFSELNDPIDQRARFESQQRDRERGDSEAHGIDEDFVHALSIGMPPTAGEGIGIDRLVMLLTDNQSIREVILFPQMRKVDG